MPGEDRLGELGPCPVKLAQLQVGNATIAKLLPQEKSASDSEDVGSSGRIFSLPEEQWGVPGPGRFMQTVAYVLPRLLGVGQHPSCSSSHSCRVFSNFSESWAKDTCSSVTKGAVHLQVPGHPSHQGELINEKQMQAPFLLPPPHPRSSFQFVPTPVLQLPVPAAGLANVTSGPTPDAGQQIVLPAIAVA